MKSNESEEMYLETILRLKKRNSIVKSIDIVGYLNYAKSSVSRGVNLLEKKNYIVFGKNGSIEFTEEGLDKATKIFERHCILTDALIIMGANQKQAEDNACKIEHVITDDVFNLFKQYVEENNRR